MPRRMIALILFMTMTALKADAGLIDYCRSLLAGVRSPVATTVAVAATLPGIGDDYRVNAAPRAPRLDQVYGAIILQLARERGVSEKIIARVSPQTLTLVALQPENIFMGATFISQFVYFAVMGTNPSHFQKEDEDGDHALVGDIELLLNHPVESLSRDDENAFLAAFNIAAERLYPGITVQGRRPTEPEWLSVDDGKEWTEEQVLAHTWVSENSRHYITRAMGLKPANDRGVYETRGHMWSVLEDPGDSYRPVIRRGGSWSSIAGYVRSAQKRCARQALRDYDVGLRFVSDMP